MEERTPYPAYKIPPRGALQDKTPPPRNVVAPINIRPAFAELEIDTALREAPRPAPNPVPPPQPIEQKTADPIRERFYQMRRLASGNPFARNNAALFYKQARFMEFFTDDYDSFTPFSMYFPQYQHMGYEQLRTYFSWRTKARAGSIAPTSLSYVFLYVYELLSGIGAKDPADGLAKLMRLWENYKEPTLELYLPGWLRDYHIYYILPQSFADFVEEHHLHAYYPDLYLFDAEGENSLAVWNGISNYDITESKFWQAGNEAILQECFAAVLRGMREMCAREGIRMEDLFYPGMRSRFPWFPFQRALFWPAHAQKDRSVELPGGTRYICHGGRWFADTVIRETGRREVVGYLIKKTEALLREATQYKHKLTANPGNLVFDMQKRKLPFAAFDIAIETAVAAFYKDKTRTVVAVDPKNLARIRTEAQDTQEKLIVDDNGSQFSVLGSQLIESEPNVEADTIRPLEYNTLQTDADDWHSFRESLTNTETELLRLLLSGHDIKPYANAQGIMPELLYDSINEKASDCIGDTILEDGVIYEEYVEKLRW
ncbi:MAG: TerB N-terminal domain-containing protein [Clostridiales bacterium]|nr:TerB N-terminal domain-containing protein [Clostridiales bacterium]